MVTVNDLIEVTSITAGTTYSVANGNVIDVVDGADKAPNPGDPDNEFNEGDTLTIGGVPYTIDRIQEPSSTGSFGLVGGGSETFSSASESDLDVMFLTVSNGATTRYFILPNDSFGDLNIESITLGGVNDVAGSDALITLASDDNVSVVCFAGSTLISTASGLRCADTLNEGDLVITQDRGPLPIVWITKSDVDPPTLARTPALQPVRIPAHAFGDNTPSRDLLVSRQHRILIASPIAGRMFDSDEVLVPAKDLIGLNGIDVETSCRGITYVHFMFDTHELVFANGLPAESFLAGPEALKTLHPTARDSLLDNFPDLDMQTRTARPARPLISGKRFGKMLARHFKNRKPLACAV